MVLPGEGRLVEDERSKQGRRTWSWERGGGGAGPGTFEQG